MRPLRLAGRTAITDNMIFVISSLIFFSFLYFFFSVSVVCIQFFDRDSMSVASGDCCNSRFKFVEVAHSLNYLSLIFNAVMLTGTQWIRNVGVTLQENSRSLDHYFSDPSSV